MKFTELDLDAALQKGILDAGFIDCMPVQEKAFPLTLQYNDVCVQSQTGTGKTALFLISIYNIFLKNRNPRNKNALIIAPTRELAIQIEKEAVLLGKHLDFTCGCFYGGVGYTQQEKLLRDDVDIVIGTPGRLIDLNQKKKLDFQKTGILVIDEADRLFDMGFLPDIRKMLKKMPPYSQRISMLFSATLSYRAKELAWDFMNNPAEIEITPEKITVDQISQKLYHVGREEKMALLLGIFKKENPKNCIIFTNTKAKAHEVSKRLEHNGYKCRYIMGDLPQNKRLKIIDNIKSGKLKYLVATDVAARGLHVDDLEMVINYDLPNDAENYVHRIGRTARAGKAGKAISLACEKFIYGLESIEKLTHTKIPVAWPDETLLVRDISAGKHFRLEKEHSGRGKSRPSKPGRPTKSKDISRKSTKPSPAGKPRKRRESSARKKNIPDKSRKNPVRKLRPEDRLEYYRKKYGENFKPAATASGSTVPEKKKSLLQKVFALFTGD